MITKKYTYQNFDEYEGFMLGEWKELYQIVRKTKKDSIHPM